MFGRLLLCLSLKFVCCVFAVIIFIVVAVVVNNDFAKNNVKRHKELLR